MKILVLNAGSSSYKCALFHFPLPHAEVYLEPLWEKSLDFDKDPPEEALKDLLESLWKGPKRILDSPAEIGAIGHRVVHGGEELKEPVLVTEKIKAAIRNLFPLAPLHNPSNLRGIELLEKWFQNVPQVAVFDTSFHSSLPPLASTYPVPFSWMQKGIKRYGFHGISHEYCSSKAASLLSQDLSSLKIISCHLGNGASLAAISKGKSLDTTMGFTPLEGLMMGSRCGSIDPGILVYLLRENLTTLDELDRDLNYNSGLKGICGVSDFRKVQHRAKEGDNFAQLAFEMYIHSVSKQVGAMAAVLEGCNVLVFTGGIGENSSLLRTRTCQKLKFLGIELDEHANRDYALDSRISLPESRVSVLVIHTREDLAIAKACARLIGLPK